MAAPESGALESAVSEVGGGDDALQGAKPIPVKKGRGGSAIRDDMAKFLAKSEKVQPPEEAVEKPEEHEEVAPEDDEETDVEPDEEISTEDEKPEPSKDKKPSRIAKLRARYEEQIGALRQEHQKSSTDRDRAVYLANVWMQRAKSTEQQLQMLQQRAQKAGQPIYTPQEATIAQLQQQLAELQLQGQWGQQQQQMQAQQQERVYIDQLKTQVTSEAVGLERKFGVPAADVLQAYAAYRQVPGNENLGMEQVARGLAALRVQNGGARAPSQRQVNGSAPRPMKPGTSAGMKFKPTVEGMTNYLASLGTPVGGRKQGRRG